MKRENGFMLLAVSRERNTRSAPRMIDGRGCEAGGGLERTNRGQDEHRLPVVVTAVCSGSLPVRIFAYLLREEPVTRNRMDFRRLTNRIGWDRRA
jgi:hypothetical protein